MNPNQVHFRRIKASDLLLLDANDSNALEGPNAPDTAAWGLHSAVHQLCPHVRCALHAHSIYATVLASLADSTLPPIDQNTATFFNRVAVDDHFGGLVFGEEAKRCCSNLSDPKNTVLVMGNHGVMVIGSTVAEAFNRLYYFERACETYIKALWTGQELRLLSDEIAEKTAREIEEYPEQAERHLNQLKAILDDEKSNYAT
ncbi:Ribulose-5-phosphate 4-epimerase and related epimerases and aldolases [hydrothermal vent metagenome]|uniref:Ribulose-5-phosphate 4-epimerase and related epimerases and aldolases n=1 Tax=hydrothermal vent metagenome TaxID=652676 RepID=A0A3B0R4S0_9ZZZZ